MLVLCNCKDCFWWKKRDEPRHLRYGRYEVGMTAYEGNCGRTEMGGDEVIGVLLNTVVNTHVKYNHPVCQGFTDRKISGHMDFSKLPQGGNIPNPVTPDAAYGV